MLINDSKLEKLKESINIYMNNNFDEPINIDEVTNTDKIEIAYTTLGDNEELNIRVALDVRAMRLESILSGEVINKIDYYNFDSFNDMTEQLKHLQFEDVIQLNQFEVDQLIKVEEDLSRIQNVKEVIGNNEYGETPYMISEMLGNFSQSFIVYGYSPEDALDNYVDHNENEHGWELPELDVEELNEEEQEKYYLAKGYYPMDMTYTSIERVEQESVENLLEKRDKEMIPKNIIEFER